MDVVLFKDLRVWTCDCGKPVDAVYIKTSTGVFRLALRHLNEEIGYVTKKHMETKSSEQLALDLLVDASLIVGVRSETRPSVWGDCELRWEATW